MHKVVDISFCMGANVPIEVTVAILCSESHVP